MTTVQLGLPWLLQMTWLMQASPRETSEARQAGVLITAAVSEKNPALPGILYMKPCDKTGYSHSPY